MTGINPAVVEPLRWQPRPGHRRRTDRARRARYGCDVPPGGPRRRRGHRQHEEHRPGRPGGRGRLPPASVPHARRSSRRSRSSRCSRCRPTTRPSGSSAPSSSSSVPASRPSVGYLGMSLAVRANLRVAAAANNERPRAGDDDRSAHRRHGRHAHRRPGPARRQHRRAHLPGRGAQGARGLRLRCRAARHVHAGRRRHLHQGRRRRRRPGRQGRAEHPRGRPAQRRDHRRQRRRQRRRLRRHGRRPVRVVRRDPGRRADPRLAGLRRQGPRLPAADPRHRRAHRGRRCLPHQAQGRRERPDHDQPGVLPLGRHRRRGQRDPVLRLPAEQLRRLHRRRRARSTDLAGGPTATRGSSPRSPWSSAS